MKTIDDVKAIVYYREDAGRDIVGRTLGLKGKEVVPLGRGDSLDEALLYLKNKNYGAKEVLVLKRYPGRRVQRCPGTQNMICCNYLLFNISFGCLYNCTYCFLNSYLNSYGITQFINDDFPEMDLTSLTRGGDDRIYRIGTGEFTDSLMLDEVTGISQGLMHGIRGRSTVILELKTKSSNVGHLLNLKHTGNTVIAWSLNTEKNISLYEGGTASLEERIEAAAAAGRAGYYLAFHFDPIIMYDGCLDEYTGVVDMLFSRVDPKLILWISLGCLRYSPGFKDIINEVFPGSSLLTGEMFPGPDGKFRYLKQRRIELYRGMVEAIRSNPGSPFLYLCMESQELWHSLFRADYASSGDLERAFSDHLLKGFFRDIK